MIHEFRLSPPGKKCGTFCDESGAFVGAIPLLKQSRAQGVLLWEPRDCEQLSKQISASFGLPIDMSLKFGGLRAIAKALNEGEVARAQIAAVLLAIPAPPPLVKGARPQADMIRFIRDLHWSGMIVWDKDACSMPSGVAASKDLTPLKIESGLAKADFNPNELRNEQGLWARDGSDEWPLDSEIESLVDQAWPDVSRGVSNLALDVGELAVRALSVEVPGLDDLALPYMESARLPYTNPAVGYTTELGLGFAIPGGGEADAGLGGIRAFEAFGNEAGAAGLGGAAQTNFLIGKSGFRSISELTDAATTKYQALYDQGYAITMRRVNARLVANSPLVIGSETDAFARYSFQDWLEVKGLKRDPENSFK